jgi:hypothetical protein
MLSLQKQIKEKDRLILSLQEKSTQNSDDESSIAESDDERSSNADTDDEKSSNAESDDEIECHSCEKPMNKNDENVLSSSCNEVHFCEDDACQLEYATHKENCDACRREDEDTGTCQNCGDYQHLDEMSETYCEKLYCSDCVNNGAMERHEKKCKTCQKYRS